jgi:hypothetical protein
LNAIATPQRCGAAGGQWDATSVTPAEAQGHIAVVHPQPVIESWTEQPWAEFCSALEQPAFLLPITGFAEL